MKNKTEEKEIQISLTKNEAKVLRCAIQEWIEKSGHHRLWWRRLGWIDAMLYSRSIYVTARDKLDNVLRNIK